MNVPNTLTISRLILTLPLIILLELDKITFVFILIILGGITDYLDGYYARKYNIKTKTGAILDPLTDKIFLLIPLLWLCKENAIPFWSLSLILSRELIISAFRNTINDGLPASKLGKYKTFSFFISLIIFFLPVKIKFLAHLGITLYWIGFVLTIITLFDYLRIKEKII